VRYRPPVRVQRIECLLQGGTVEPGGTGQPNCIYTLDEGGCRTKRLLRGLGERTETPAHDADDGGREIAGERVDECPVPGRPGRRIVRRSESRSHGLEHHDHEECDATRVSLHPAGQTLLVTVAVSLKRSGH